MSRKHQIRARVGRLLLVAALAVPSIGVASSAAWASTSGSTHGCYVEWWNTAWAAKCAPAGVSGKYQAHVDYRNQVDYRGPWVTISKGATTTFDRGESWFGVQSGNTYVSFKN
jgi:hypothetical protein